MKATPQYYSSYFLDFGLAVFNFEIKVMACLQKITFACLCSFSLVVQMNKVFCIFQGIIHLVIGSLGADPITTGDYYGIKLEHVNTNESFWLNSKVTMGEVRGKHEALYPADEWK